MGSYEVCPRIHIYPRKLMMNKVAHLYDNLFSLNSKRKNDEAYPIHKTLNYEDGKIGNLYEYLLRHYDLPTEGKLLDCGCGVGYGSLLLAGQFKNLSVKGISLSTKEITLANKNCTRNNLTDNCHFEVRSFDDLPEDTFDCIIAIESLKHSPDIKKTMPGLIRSLRKNGNLIIIEDVLKSPVINFATRRQCSDWELQRLFVSEDYLNHKGLTSKDRLNMTSRMKIVNKFSAVVRVAFSEFLVGLGHIGIRKIASSKIIRGGIYQELLYSTGKLDYLILSAKKES